MKAIIVQESFRDHEKFPGMLEMLTILMLKASEMHVISELPPTSQGYWESISRKWSCCCGFSFLTKFIFVLNQTSDRIKYMYDEAVLWLTTGIKIKFWTLMTLWLTTGTKIKIGNQQKWSNNIARNHEFFQISPEFSKKRLVYNICSRKDFVNDVCVSAFMETATKRHIFAPSLASERTGLWTRTGWGSRRKQFLRSALLFCAEDWCWRTELWCFISYEEAITYVHPRPSQTVRGLHKVPKRRTVVQDRGKFVYHLGYILVLIYIKVMWMMNTQNWSPGWTSCIWFLTFVEETSKLN